MPEDLKSVGEKSFILLNHRGTPERREEKTEKFHKSFRFAIKPI
jgi:hypothetical protein